MVGNFFEGGSHMLNTALIEGVLIEPVTYVEEEMKAFLKIKNVVGDSASIFPLVVEGNTAEICRNVLKVGDMVRAVGKLVLIDTTIGRKKVMWVRIYVEHIEFRKETTCTA